MKNLICDKCGENSNSNQFCLVEGKEEMLLCESCIDDGLRLGIVIELSKEENDYYKTIKKNYKLIWG